MGPIMSTTVYQSSDTPNHSSNDALSRGSAQYFTATPSRLKSKETNIQLRLTSLLQTTLKIEPLFDLFFGELQHLLNINSCHYIHADKKLDVNLGKISTHSTDYSLKLQDSYLGNIVFSRKQRFSEDELLNIESLLSILMYPLRNALSYRDALQQALSDPLTGLANRGALEKDIAHQWQMAQRYSQHFCVLMLDIDHFKSINDTYGHAVGDEVLREVANSISETTRQTDVTYRYGGEEFVVILNKSELVGASIIAERIRENIESLEVPIGNEEGKNIKVTISIGGSCSAHNSSSGDLMKQADKVLYHAKNQGRNRVELSEINKKNHLERKLRVTSNAHQS